MNTSRPATQWGDRDQRRIDILRAGERLLREGGYSALRMRDVADGAGISLGTVYTYFANKENLFIGVFAEQVVDLTERLRPRIESAADFTEVFTAAATEYREQYLNFGRQFDALGLVHDPGTLQPAVEQHLRDATGGLIGVLGAALVDLGYEGDPRPAMALLWSTVTGLANHYTTARQDFLGVPWDDEIAFAAERLGRSLGVL
ncbi:TetR/AcrR family transcriptional regulator [Tsukamurella sp. NPDC003166]|uniref:TetR/AcrR family transcriptional regulator n=1 Tax=Tsukamurella sp. NPDC003166 TaxID=3154444 RepID=UPI0033ABB25F